MTQAPHEQVIAEPMPAELYGHLSALHPKSYEFQKEFSALNDLASETGHRVLTMEDIFPPLELTPPEGFKSAILMSNGAELPVDQFTGVIKSLHGDEKTITPDLVRLVTDSGIEINYCDLRPFMTSSVREGGPTEKGQNEALDRSVFRDLKFLAETGHPRRAVTGVKGVSYTRLGKTKVRSYWMPVVTTDKSSMTVARLADCADSIPAEGDLYRRVFGIEL